MSVGPVARLACNVCCFIYPAYASYKALSIPNSGPRGQRQGGVGQLQGNIGDPVHGGAGSGGLGDETIERWLMYWSVVGLWTAVETTVGWTFTWIPFYSLFKLLIFLYFSLPQTQGSSMVYNRYLAPAFAEHETDIDAALGNLRSQATTSLADALSYLWRFISQQLNSAAPGHPYPSDPNAPPGYPAYQSPTHQPQFAAPPAPPPSFQDPAAGAAQRMYGFLGRYAGQYIPVAATALQAAAAAAAGSRPLNNQEAQAAARMVHESMAMPVPQPTPGVGGLRAMTHAQAETSARVASGGAEGVSARMRNVSSGSFGPSPPQGQPGLVHHDSHGSDSSRSSFSGLGFGAPPAQQQQQQHGWGGDMSSYESISHADVPAGADVGYHVGAGGSLTPSKGASPQRPEGKKRTSSWFGRGNDEREKTE